MTEKRNIFQEVMADFQVFKHHLLMDRSSGVGIVELDYLSYLNIDAQSTEDMISRYATYKGMSVSRSFDKIEQKSTARRMLTEILSKCLCYTSEPIIPENEADSYASRFLDYFSNEASFFTSYQPIGGPPIHSREQYFGEGKETYGGFLADFHGTALDCGVLAIDKEKIGIVWFGDFS